MSVAVIRPGKKKTGAKTADHSAHSDHSTYSAGDGGSTPGVRVSTTTGRGLGAFYTAGPVLGLPVQRKVVIGRVNDPYEKEADSVADRVTTGRDVPFVSRITPGSLGAPGHSAPVQRQEEEKEEEPVQEMAVQRQEEEKEEEPVQEMAVQRQEEEKEEEPVQEMAVQRQEEEKEEEPVQSKAASSGPNAPSTMHSAAAGAIRGKGPGEPMKPSTRRTLESRMGTDLSDVRVHSDNSAHDSAGALKAKAFTHKQHIWLGRGQSQDDLRLMAHETTHVLQQDGIVRRKPLVEEAPGDETLKEKDEETEEKKEEPPAAGAPPGEKPVEIEEKKPETKAAKEPKAPEIKPLEAREPKTPAVKAPAGGKAPVEGKAPAEGKAAPGIAPAPVQKPAAPGVEASGKEGEKEETPVAGTTGKEETEVEAAAGETETAAAEKEGTEEEAAPGVETAGGEETAAPGEGEKKSEKKGEKEGEVKEGEKEKEGEKKGKKAKGKKDAEKKEGESPAQDRRFQGVMKRLKKNAQQERTHEPGQKKVNDARAAVVPPDNDRSSRAQANQVDEMDKQEAKKPETDSFLEMLRAELERITPKNMDEMKSFKKKGQAGKLKNKLTSKVEGQKAAAAGGIKTAAETKPDPNSVEPKEVVEMPKEPPNPDQINLRSQDVLPLPKKEKEISVEDNKEKAEQLMSENDIDEQQLKDAGEPQFDEALNAKKELEEHADKVPEEYRTQEQAHLDKTKADVKTDEKKKKDGMRADREKGKESVKSKQQEAKKKEEDESTKAANKIQAMYEATKEKVENKLKSLDEEVNTLFDNGEKKARDAFETYVDDQMSDYKRRRYSGVIGKGRWLKDRWFDLPSTVNRFYEDGKKQYIKDMDGVLVNIANRVETVLKEAKEEIKTGIKEIAEYVETLDKSVKSAAQDTLDDVNSQFKDLEEGVDDKKKELARSMAKKYKESRDKLDERIKELKAANRGLLSRFVAKIKEIIQILRDFKNRIGAILQKGAGVIRAIVKNPIGFLGNLLGAVKKGFNQFSGRILAHLKKGLMDWLFGTMTKAGIQLPTDFSVKSIFGLVMQILGLTPEGIKQRVVRIIGEKNAGRIEKAWSIISTLVSKGPAGLWEEIKAYLGNFKEMVIGGIRDWLITKVIEQGVIWVVSLFNPASALIKAIKLIYDVVMFFVENINRIMDLVNAVIESVSMIVAGKTGAAANWIENAMARTLPIIIGFMARVLGLSGISDKIRSIIKKIRRDVEKAVDKVLKKIIGKVKGLLGKGKKAVKAVKKTAKKAVEKIKRFIFPKKEFTAGEESHTIFFKGTGRSAKVMVASGRPKTLTNLLNELKAKPENKEEDKKKVIRSARTRLRQLDKIQDRLDKETDEKKQEAIRGEIRGKLNQIAPLLAELLHSETFGTKKYPIELEWPKPASKDYPKLYFGPKSDNRIPQSSLKKAKEGDKRFIAATEKKLSADNLTKWRKKNHLVREYIPHRSANLPEGEGPIGISSDWRIAVGKELKLPKTPQTTPGGGLLNDILRPYGFSPKIENLDADHVVEMQMGGQNVRENMWPLNSKINRASGKILSRRVFDIKGKRIPMKVLKARAKKKLVYFKITSTR